MTVEAPMFHREGKNVHVVTASGVLRLDWQRLLVVTAFVMNTGQSDEQIQQRLANANPEFADLGAYLRAARQVAEHRIDLNAVA